MAASALSGEERSEGPVSSISVAPVVEGSARVSAAIARPEPTTAPSATPTDTAEAAATGETAAPALDPTATLPAPTATPAPPTPTAAPAWDYHPVAQLSAAEVSAAAASAGWPANLIPQVVEVSWCESSHRPNASNGWAYGVMQLVPNWFDFAGVDFAEWTDPVTNLRVALAAYEYDIARGNAPWTQWVCRPSEASLSATIEPVPTATTAPPAALGGQ